MGYYEVYLSDGVNSQVSIFDAGVKELALLNAVVSLGVNEAGSFEFTIPPQHVFYNNIIPYGSSIEVRENNETIFFGRPLPPTIDFWGNKKFHCEGALAFLNDVYLPPVDELSDEVEFNTLMDMVLGQYNRLQIRYDRQFAYDTDNFPSTMIYDPEEWNYQSVLDYIRNYMHQFVGGYFYAEWQGGLLELKWKQKLTDWSNQPITFGANLLEIMRVGQPFYTAAIAKGGEDIDGNLAAMTTPYVASEEVRMKYGTITAYLDRPSATVVDALEAYCEAYLEDQQFNGVSFEISAADQHLLNGEYDEYRVGQQVHVISPDQYVDVILPITHIKVDINSAVKKVTVGDLAIMPITISQKKAEKEAEKKTKETSKKEAEKVKEDSNDSLVIKGADGNDYEISVDEGGNVIATKIAKSIELIPSSKEYNSGDAFDSSEFTVIAHFGDGTTQNVTSKSTFNIENGYIFVENDPNYQLRASYRIGGKNYVASSKIIIKKGAPTPASEVPTQINSWITLMEAAEYCQTLVAGGEYDFTKLYDDENYHIFMQQYANYPGYVSFGYINGWNEVYIYALIDAKKYDPWPVRSRLAVYHVFLGYSGEINVYASGIRSSDRYYTFVAGGYGRTKSALFGTVNSL